MREKLHAYIGEYQLTEFLGAGGMGEVYRAVHRRIGRDAAVKFLSRMNADSTLRERFVNEARIQSFLHHPNVAALYDFQEVDGVPCIIMEYIDGHTLHEHIRSAGKLRTEEILSIFRDILSAVGYIHGQGIVHRDIKAVNVKISARGEVKLLDFGIAKSEYSPSLTQSGNFIGTLEYLAPEILQGGPASAQSDIWSLGVLLYQMATGQAPFEATSMSDLCDKVCHAVYSKPSSLVADIPREIEKIIGRCLKLKPSERYASIADIIQDIDRLAKAPSSASGKRPARATPPTGGFPRRLESVRAYWPLLLATLALAAFLSIAVFWQDDGGEPSSVPERAADSDAENVAPAPIVPPRALRNVKIGVIGESADLYLERQGAWSGPYKTPFQFQAPLGERIGYSLKRGGFSDECGHFNVQVTNEYVYRMDRGGSQRRCPP
jgi:serine/threonine-protein kinase